MVGDAAQRARCSWCTLEAGKVKVFDDDDDDDSGRYQQVRMRLAHLTFDSKTSRSTIRQGVSSSSTGVPSGGGGGAGMVTVLLQSCWASQSNCQIVTFAQSQ